MPNEANRFVLPDNQTQDWLSNVGDAVYVGDLMYDGGSEKARPANKLTTLTTEALDQAQFTPKFIGVSQQQVLSTETNATKRITIRVAGVAEFTCPSQAFNKGDLVGVYSDGSALDPQKVDLVTHPAMAIGVVVKTYTSATTRVRVAFFSRKTLDICHSQSSPCVFGGQTVAAFNLLSDANSTLTVGSGIYQKMVPTTGRTVTLPAEAQSKGLAFVIWNNSGGANSLTIKKSDGSTSVDGNPTVAQNKVGIFFCDGATWVGMVGA